jgi:hypothetical protein
MELRLQKIHEDMSNVEAQNAYFDLLHALDLLEKAYKDVPGGFAIKRYVLFEAMEGREISDEQARQELDEELIKIRKYQADMSEPELAEAYAIVAYENLEHVEALRRVRKSRGKWDYLWHYKRDGWIQLTGREASNG